MNLTELREIEREAAIKMADPSIQYIDARIDNMYPEFSDVIVFGGGGYWKDYDSISRFVEEFLQPSDQSEVCRFFQDLARNIATDPRLVDSELRKNVNVEFSILYDQYSKLIRNNPTKYLAWADSEAKYIWYEYILPKRRQLQFLKIIKDQDTSALNEISVRVKKIYGFSDLEMIYLKYFCSQAKVDDLDPSLNTVLYFWSKQKRTGKTTIAAYICSFLNGEAKRNENAHKSTLSREMQMKQFDIPAAVNSRCVMLDEAAFHDMAKTYDRFKTMVTSNSCEIEYKYKSSHIPKRCFRNYIFTSNDDPIWFVQDESERRILSVHFNTPEQTSFAELEQIWYKFVLECNYSAKKLEAIYLEIIMPNCQSGDIKHIMLELMDVFSFDRISSINGVGTSFFSVSNVMLFPEIVTQKLPRSVVKEILIQLYGEPDKNQRFFKKNRVNSVAILGDEDARWNNGLPF